MSTLSHQVQRFIRCCWLAGIDADEMIGMSNGNRRPYPDEVKAVRKEFARLNAELERAEEVSL